MCSMWNRELFVGILSILVATRRFFAALLYSHLLPHGSPPRGGGPASAGHDKRDGEPDARVGGHQAQVGLVVAAP